MRRAMAEAEAGEGAARERVLDRRLLAEEIGQAEDAVAARRHARRRGDRARGCGFSPPASEADRRGEPVERRARGRHAAVRRIEAGDEMIVEEEAPIGTRDVGGDDDVAGAAELEQHVAGAGHARGERRGDVVGRAAEDGQSLPAVRFRPPPRRVTVPSSCCEACLRRNGVPRNMRQRDEIVVDRVGRRDRRSPLPAPSSARRRARRSAAS